MKKARQITAVILSFMLMISTVAGQIPASPMVSAAGYGISNPRADSSGVTTWDCIWFGNYWQSSETTKEPVKWRVLSINGDDAFLLADQNLDCQPYNTEGKSVTWAPRLAEQYFFTECVQCDRTGGGTNNDSHK